PNQDSTFVTNVRHYDALRQASSALQDCRTSLSRGIPSDLVAEDLRAALYHLGTITGAVSSDEVLGLVFSRFCIGK
ncbi:MAG: tRNA uridine-5-carboxymethylaminomethyl(34) synthesis GTPase MnmE, partial [Bacteroidales bacterium]|nr:tRNA uridine-5-carboxymethylaminomethyl(34) synthesis GTPase MnmE [Bacteroidales bacterium]